MSMRRKTNEVKRGTLSFPKMQEPHFFVDMCTCVCARARTHTHYVFVSLLNVVIFVIIYFV